jgi:hypothetical protein
MATQELSSIYGTRASQTVYGDGTVHQRHSLASDCNRMLQYRATYSEFIDCHGSYWGCVTLKLTYKNMS